MPDGLNVSPQLLHWISRAAANVRLTGLYYLIVAGVFCAAWLWWRSRPSGRQPLQARRVAPRQVVREIITSAGAVLVFGLVVPVLFALGLGRHFRFYWHIADRGWAWFLISILLMLAIQDTWFYWTHRLMHHGRLFCWFHLTHHRSTNPNPWTTYSMNALEALVLSGASVTTLLLVPTTGAALIIVGWLNIIYGVYGHLGYELYPRSMATHWLGRWINTSVAHNAHHAKGRYNYGYYFLFWDRAMGTLDPNYGTEYRAQTSKRLPA